MQRRHFLLFNVGPLLGTLGAVAWAFVTPVRWLDIGLFFAMWLATGLGVSAGYHRHFTHRSFCASEPIRVLLAVLGSMAGLGPVISWVAMHRRHHQCADKAGDMHSPNLHGASTGGKVRGFLHAHLTWMVKHDYPNIAHYARDLLEDRKIASVSRHYQWWILLGLVLPTGIGGLATGTVEGAVSGFLWGGAVRMFVVAQSISALNSVLHSIGSRKFGVVDNSRNSAILGLFIWGEGWHHNHHAFPTSASFALAWYRIDLSYWFIRLLGAVGLAWDIKVPTRRQIASRMASAHQALPDMRTTQSAEAE
jgi:stearoyl-CoA desaturase (delta-9 desaturase)